MTKQETFDTVVAHLRKQGAKSINDLGHCLYRGPNGLKCAAGIVLPDEKYSLDMEGFDVDDLKEHFEGHNLQLLADLQNVHDGYDVDVWEKRFEVIAEKHGLDCS